ncbi:MAG: hypothetical protein ACRD8W_29970 [Nitrososphaeraceae archaeon]
MVSQPIFADSNSTVRINFTDAFSGGPLDADVMYDLLILDNNEIPVIEKEGLLAEDSIDSQILTFPMEGQYQMELHINGLRMAGQDTPDLKRNGIAKGHVIVSESESPTSIRMTP